MTVDKTVSISVKLITLDQFKLAYYRSVQVLTILHILVLVTLGK